MKNVYIGIDPGSVGCAVALDREGKFLSMIRFNSATHADIAKFLREIVFHADGNVFCLLEQVGIMPGEGVSSAFTFGKNVGLIEGMLTALDIPYETKIPRTWQKLFGIQPRFKPKKGESGVEESKTEFKRRVRGYAERLFPDVKMTNDIADALLIAEAGRRMSV